MVVARTRRAALFARRAVLWLRLAVIQASAAASLRARSVTTCRRTPPIVTAHSSVAGWDSIRQTEAARSGWRAA
jgi:hypothetical protein